MSEENIEIKMLPEHIASVSKVLYLLLDIGFELTMSENYTLYFRRQQSDGIGHDELEPLLKQIAEKLPKQYKFAWYILPKSPQKVELLIEIMLENQYP